MRPHARRCALLVGALAASVARAPAQSEQPVQRIAFGSCAKQDRPQPIWDAIVAQDPDLFIFTGDNVYADTDDMQVMRGKYAKLAAVPGFQKLRESCTVLATWDDHDYGRNDAGREYAKKRESQQAFLDFFDEPADSRRRQTPGVYDAKVFGPAGKRVQVILLDTRYFRTALKRGEPDEPGDGRPGRYVPNDDPDGTILGQAQWQWLEQRLGEPADVRVIVSSIQVVANEHRFEKWGNIPHERRRQFKLIRETGAGGVIFISGDRHMAELSRLDAGVAYPLYDLTSSGLTQRTNWYNEFNPHRIGSIYREPNFGLITIDWNKPDPRVSLEIRRENGDAAIRHGLSLSAIQFPK